MGLRNFLWIFLVCAAGLAISVYAYRHQWTLSALPPDPRLESLTYPVTIDDYQAGSLARLRFLAESWPPGTIFQIRDDTGLTIPVVLERRLGMAGLVMTGVSGFVFLMTAIGFFAPRLHQHGYGRFFWVLFPYGMSILLGGVYFPRDGSVFVLGAGFLQLVWLAVLPVAFFRLALVFPRRSDFLDRNGWLLPVLSAVAVGIVAWQSVAFLRFFADPGPPSESAIVPALFAADLFIVSLTGIGFLVFVFRNRGLEMTRERQQFWWLLWGFAIGGAPYVFLRTLPALAGLPPLLPDYVDRIVEMAIPLAFMMAVVKHQFLDIDVIVRRSLLYGLLAGVLVGIYLVAGIVFGRWLGDLPGLDPWVLPVGVGLVAGASFAPLRRSLGRWIDRIFFKLAHDHDIELERIDGRLAGAAEPKAVARILVERFDAALLPLHSAVILRDGENTVSAGDIPPGWSGWLLTEPLVQQPLLVAAPRSTSMPEVERDDLPLDLLEEGFVILQPVVKGDEHAGVIILGSRRTGRRYVRQDLTFLASVARVAARHLERIALMQTVAAETLARRRLAELDRLKSEFLAQVAHDLRTPVAGITWSARNLMDGLAGDLNEGQARYLGSISSSGAHLNRLVDNLLEISRLEDARNQFENGPFQAIDAWREALENLRPLAAEKDVTLELAGEDHAVPVTGNHDKLVEVTVNLLDNAVKYTETGSTVTVTVRPPEGGYQVIGVRDQGPGLRGQDPATLFGRFAQGEPSPHSSRKGFGLGLHIAATYLDLMGGSLTAADHPDGGAVFACRLPLADSPPDHPGQGDPS